MDSPLTSFLSCSYSPTPPQVNEANSEHPVNCYYNMPPTTWNSQLFFFPASPILFCSLDGINHLPFLKCLFPLSLYQKANTKAVILCFLAYIDGWIITEAQSIYSFKQTIQFSLLPNFIGTIIIIYFTGNKLKHRDI